MKRLVDVQKAREKTQEMLAFQRAGLAERRPEARTSPLVDSEAYVSMVAARVGVARVAVQDVVLDVLREHVAAGRLRPRAAPVGTPWKDDTGRWFEIV